MTRNTKCPIQPRSQSVAVKRVVKFNYNAKSDPDLSKRKTKSALELRKISDYHEESLEVFVFEDRNLYRTYLDICRERDEVPHSQPQRIEILKKRDPIFAKRYKQFLSAKTCNKAPKFDMKDFTLPSKLPKSTLKREREKMIKIAHDTPYRKPEIFKLELERINLRVKHFIDNFDSKLTEC